MSGLIRLDADKIEASIGVLEKQVNGAVLENVSSLAVVLKDSGDDNKQVQEMLEVAVKFQTQYNTFIDGVNGFIKDAGQVYDLAEYMAKKATVGDIAGRDVSFQNSNIDTSRIQAMK